MLALQKIMSQTATRFVLFEVGRPNVGDATERPSMSELLGEWNAVLDADGVRFVGSVGHTGNYVAETAKVSSPAALRDLLIDRLNVKVAVFDAADFVTWASAACPHAMDRH